MLSSMRAGYAVVAGILMTLAFTGTLRPEIVLVLAALTGLVRPSDMGLRGALIAETMPFDRLTSAMSISRTTSDSARIAGALAGAGMFAAFGIGPAYVAVTACYLLSVVLTWCTEPVKPRPAATAAVDAAATSSPWRDLRDGMAHVWSTPSLLALIWLAFLFNLTAFPITNGLLPYVAREIYHVDQTGLGYLVAGLATGALLGSIALTRSSHTMQLSRLMIVSALLWQALLLAFAQMQSMPGGLLFLTLAGVMQSLTMVSHSVILLRASGQRFRGRIMGVRMLAIYSLPLGLLAAGVLIERVGFRTTATLYAGVGLIFTVLMATYWRAQLWRPRGPAEGP
jgi:Na+/melibiose symporter-like transporter